MTAAAEAGRRDPARAPGRVSVIVTTYEWPRALELCLEGYAAQDDPDFEVVVADDGSGEETARTVERVQARTGLDVVHVWHPDRGFRKTEILDRAIARSEGDYLVFTDADCIPREDLVRSHREEAAPGAWLSGGYVRLSPDVTDALEPDDVRTGRVFDAGWLRRRGMRLGRHALRLLPRGRAARALDLLTPTGATFNGMNSSVWKEAALAVDGFELGFTYGGLDREFGERLRNLGLKGRQVRHRSAVVHLHHARPWRDRASLERQERWRADVRRSGRVRAERGISSLDDTVETRVLRYGRGPRAAAGGPGAERGPAGAAPPERASDGAGKGEAR